MTDDPAVMRAMLHDLNLDRPHQISLLDLFAREAMGKLLAGALAGRRNFWMQDEEEYGGKELGTQPLDRDEDYTHLPHLAEMAYEVASAMLREREKRLTNPPT